MMEEITEKLLTDDNKPPKKKKKRTIIFIILGLIFVAAIGFGAYYYFNDYKYNKALEIAQNYLDEEDYDNAILSFKEAIDIAPKKVQAYEGLAEAAILSDQPEVAKEAYDKLYEITKEPRYMLQASSIISGISVGNASNGGYIVEQGDSVFLLDTEEHTFNLWEINNNTPRYISQYYYGEIIASPHPVMNVYGPNLYFDLNGMLLKQGYQSKIDLYNTYLNDYTQLIEAFQIYNNKIYFIDTPNNNTPAQKRLGKMDLDGNNVEYFAIGTANYSNLYVCDGQIFYVAYTNYSDNALYHMSVDSSSPELIYQGGNSLVYNVTYSDNKLYYNFLDTMTMEYLPEVGIFDLETNEATIEKMDEAISSINSNAENLYYIKGDKLYKDNFDFSEPEELYSENINNTTAMRTVINLSSENIYLITYHLATYDTYFGGPSSFRVASLENPKTFEELNLVPYENVSEEVKTVYQEFLPTVFEKPDAAYYPSSFASASVFMLYDINRDDIPELIVDESYGGDLRLYHFYTYQNGEVVELTDPVQGLITFTGESDPYSGNLIMYNNIYPTKDYEKELVEFDGTTLTFTPLGTVTKTSDDTQIFEGYNIPMSNADSDYYFQIK